MECNVSGLGQLENGARLWVLRAFTLVMMSCLLAKINKWKFGGMSGDARESQVIVVEGGFPRISARGYIIISKVKIYYLNKRYTVYNIYSIYYI